MSLRDVVTVVGTGVGFLVGQPGLGYALGSMVGNLIDPQTIQGPRIGEIQKQTAQEGGSIPIVFGMSPPITGNVIASSDAMIVTETSGGKGGQKVESESAYRTYAIGVCEGPISGFVRIWRNNKLVFDASDEPLLDVEENSQFMETARFFFGAYDQDASSDLEAIFGVGTTAAHRGIAYVVMANENVTDMGGAIPQWVFQIGQSSAPVLSDPVPSGTVGSETEATIGATTNQPFGTLYIVVGEGSELDGITAEQIIALVNAAGAEAYDEGTAEVSDGTPGRLFITLTAGDSFTYAMVQVNDNGISNVVGGSFTMAAVSLPTFIAGALVGTIIGYRDPSHGTAVGTEVVAMVVGVHEILILWDRDLTTAPKAAMYVTNSFSTPDWWDTITVNGVTLDRTDATLTNGGGADIAIYTWPSGQYFGMGNGETYTVEFA